MINFISGKTNRFLLTIIFILVLIFTAPGLQHAAAATSVGYKDFLYTGATAPTGQKPQSKLWFNDGI